MKIGVPKETYSGEKRVATTPEVVNWLQKLGYSVSLEAGAGAEANFSDAAYSEAGAEIATDIKTLWDSSDIIFKVRAPDDDEIELLHDGQTLISFIWPAQNESLMEKLSAKKVNILAMDSVPRISRAQKMDALSSMANIAGYRAIVEASHNFGRFFTGQITAAGKVPPAKVLVIGAGVAGLAAIGAANSLGAIVRSFDTRPEVKEQVESMGADFLLLEFKEDGSGEGGYAKTMSDEFIAAEMALFAEQAKEVDIIVTTALIPGKPAPKLITTEMVNSMKNGSVIVDLAAEQGGNCELTVPHKLSVTDNGVTIIGYSDLPSRLPTQSSQLYSTNLRHLITDMTPEKDGVITIDFEDEAVRGATVVKSGEITWPPPQVKLSAASIKPAEAPAPVKKEEIKPPSLFKQMLPIIIGSLVLLGVGSVAPASFMTHFTVFVLSCFIGYMVIWNVSASLHTPLMSVTNAVSSIIVIGALVQISSSDPVLVSLAAFGILITSINIVGGFAVTQRMLDMFRK
jgi:H+-translocating NAD(P) transhydrogenase subunit alpha